MSKQTLTEKKIILFGGTFDPVHLGHLILAQEAQNFLFAEKVFFIPCYQSPHKLSRKPTYWKHRIKMLLLATKNNQKFFVSDYEIKQKKVSYAYNTIEHFCKKYKGYKIYFLMGMDSLLEFKLWKNWKKILETATIIVGVRLVKNIRKVNDLIRTKKVILLHSPKIEVSSENIRKLVKQKKSIKYLVTPEVEKYILKHKLYI
ncbi:MAG: nicotinate (nicotinamide) nucleotide adenylyltransferase [Endomicrobiia bacterium]